MEHHVYFWLNEDRKNSADRAAFEAGLAKLFEIATVAGGMWGRQASTPQRPVTDKSWDYALSMSFETLETHNSYQEDPDHDVFVAAFKDWWARVLVMDLQAP